MWFLDKLIHLKKKEKLICQFCKKDISPSPAYVIIQGTVIKNVKSPSVFLCPEQAFNYAQGIIVHDTCWIKMLKEYGSPLFDMKKVIEKYNKKSKKE